MSTSVALSAMGVTTPAAALALKRWGRGGLSRGDTTKWQEALPDDRAPVTPSVAKKAKLSNTSKAPDAS